MAKCLGPLHSSEARGRVGGLVFNTWRGGATCKAKHAPAQPRSSLQLAARAYASQLARMWGTTLDATDRKTWNDYAVAHQDKDWTGTNVRLSGLNWFIRCSSRLLAMGNTVVHTAPLVAAPDPIVSFQALDGVLLLRMMWQAAAGTDLTADFWLEGPFSNGRLSKIQRAKHNCFHAAQTPDFNIAPLGAGHYTVYARIISEVNGLASTWLSDPGDVTAT